MTDAFHLALTAVSLVVLGYGMALLTWTASLIVRAALARRRS